MDNQSSQSRPKKSTNRALWIVLVIFILSVTVIVIFTPMETEAYFENINETFKGPGFFNSPNTHAGLDVLAMSDTITGVSQVAAGDSKIIVAGMGKQDENFIASPYIYIYRPINFIYNSSFSLFDKSFCPFECNYQGGFRLGRGYRDYHLIVTPNENAEPLLKIYDVNSLQIINTYYAYPKDMTSGLKAEGFIDNTGAEHVVTMPNKGGRPHLRIFNRRPNKIPETGFGGYSTTPGVAEPDFPGSYVYHQDFRGGVDIAIGDVDGDGASELVTVPESDATARVKVYEFNEQGNGVNLILSEFIAFPNEEYGATVEVADLDYDGTEEIIVIDGKGSSGLLKVFNYNGTEKDGFGDYYAYSDEFLGGAQVSFGGYQFLGTGFGTLQDTPNRYRLFFAAGPGGGAHIRFADFKMNP